MRPPLPNWLRRAWSLSAPALKKFRADNGLFLASALAFNLLLYFIPLSLLIISLLGYTVLDSERAMSEVQSVLKAFLPRSQQALVENLTAVVAARGLLGFAGVASFGVFSTLLFGTVRTVLNRVFEVRHERTVMAGMAIDLLFIGLSLLLVLLVMASTWALTLIGNLAERYPFLGTIVVPGLPAFAQILGVLLTALLFFVLYRFAPATRLSLRAELIAALTGTGLFQLAKWAFRWYAGLAQDSLVLYGALGGVMFLFVWLYYVSVVFVLGAEVGWAYDRHKAAPEN